MSMYLFKRQINKRGLALLSCFCVYALVLLVPGAAELVRIYREKDGTDGTGLSWRAVQCLLFLSVLVSLVNPLIAMIKPGFSFKGHPGKRHILLLITGAIIIILSSAVFIANFVWETPFLTTKNDLILYGMVYPLHGLHCITIYCSYFKGPTSKFGKIYQPYLPIIE